MDIDKPAIPCNWWKDSIDILNDGILLREYKGLYMDSRELGGPVCSLF